ncbi:MAG TPA: hypothetical protein VK919_10530 [Solirubrobacterales bacterium]|nr:hypothetical protein [Solirubrobacterales bacterium]
MKRTLGAPRVKAPLGLRKRSFGGTAAGLGWAALGAVAVSATVRALFRSRRVPATDAATDAASEDQQPDVLLDVRELEVARINLEVEDLRAHVSVLAELANVVKLSVGVDATLDRVKLEIEGVEAKVLLKVRLEHVRAILEKALDTIAEHPEILRILSRSLSRLGRESLGEAQATLSEVLEGVEVGDTVDEVLRGRLEEVGATLDDILARPAAGSGAEGATRRALAGDSVDDAASSAQGEASAE